MEAMGTNLAAEAEEAAGPGATPEGRRLHEVAEDRLVAVDQRYTRSRRTLVEALAGTDRPMTITEILAGAAGIPQSSAYRNLTVLCEAGVARRVPGADDLGRFELAEDLTGHHHHLVCSSCGAVADFGSSPRLERTLAEAARQVAEETGYVITGHRLDFEGLCEACR
jgi:Fe2+ or Zn2+ uptake regulation protein